MLKKMGNWQLFNGWLTLATWLLIGWSQITTADWPLPRGTAEGTGATAEVLADQLELLWEHRQGGLGFDSGPIIAAGKVFAADADGNLLALNLDTGQVVWKLKLDTGFMSSPAYHEQTIYIGDLDGVIRAHNAHTGQELWSYNAEREIDAGGNFFGDSLLMTSQSGSLLAIDRRNGRLLWRYDTEDQLQCGPTLAGHLTFLGGCDQHLHIVDVRTGQSATDKIPIQAPTGSTPSISDQVVLVPNHKGQIWAFATNTFRPLWMFEDSKLANEFRNNVAVADGLVVAASGNRRLFALDMKTGDVVWQQTLRRRVESSPVIAGDKVAVAGSDGRIMLLELKTGTEVWSFEVKGSFLGSPAVAHGKLVVASDRGDILCFGSPSS
ncbi:MAG: PQQ-binding-like beta-propeller repeat protein [Pirellulaceae bacterium]|nr:PQQ-binding-like beta-propeller repeat protein [Pirellulaceae bacterium]